MDKAPDAFRTISEVAEDLRLPQHVLRFWESRFTHIKPMKRAGGRRYYRPDDVDLLRGIHHLLYGQGYTIRGVQRILRDQGLKFVQGVWQPGAEQPLAHVPENADNSSDSTDAERGEGGDNRISSTSSADRLSLTNGRLSPEKLRRLQEAVVELTECRQLLESSMRPADPPQS